MVLVCIRAKGEQPFVPTDVKTGLVFILVFDIKVII
jgi:hypothetical protein